MFNSIPVCFSLRLYTVGVVASPALNHVVVRTAGEKDGSGGVGFWRQCPQIGLSHRHGKVGVPGERTAGHRRVAGEALATLYTHEPYGTFAMAATNPRLCGKVELVLADP